LPVCSRRGCPASIASPTFCVRSSSILLKLLILKKIIGRATTGKHRGNKLTVCAPNWPWENTLKRPKLAVANAPTWPWPTKLSTEIGDNFGERPKLAVTDRVIHRLARSSAQSVTN
jgi:hypothetical protein